MMMPKLDFPEYDFRIRKTGKEIEIFDIIRKKFVALTAEEWVRQHAIHFLIFEKNVPAGRMNVEFSFSMLTMPRRVDIVAFTSSGEPALLVECKAPNIKITQSGFDQIARYNIALQAKYLLVTNGLQHFFCTVDFKNRSCQFLPDIPCYEAICSCPQDGR